MAPFVVLEWIAAAVVAFAADGYEHAPFWLLAVNQLLLVPALVGASWWLGRRLAGRIGAAVAPLAVTLVPLLGTAYASDRLEEAYVNRVLTQAVGVAEGWAFAAGALLLVAVCLVVQGSRSLAGAGIALALTVVLAAALNRGVGLDVSKDAFDANMAGLREFTWSNRILQWLPIAGAIGVARRSPLTALLLASWFGALVVAYAASPNVTVGDGTLAASLVPALPAFSLLVAGVPLLIPTVPARLEPRPS